MPLALPLLRRLTQDQPVEAWNALGICLSDISAGRRISPKLLARSRGVIGKSRARTSICPLRVGISGSISILQWFTPRIGWQTGGQHCTLGRRY
jgi:hypothetical protein